MDIDLISAVSEAVSVPVIASGGVGSADHIVKAAREGKADAVAVADALHYQRLSICEMRKALREAGISVREQ